VWKLASVSHFTREPAIERSERAEGSGETSNQGHGDSESTEGTRRGRALGHLD
jgi:hypothetical protein